MVLVDRREGKLHLGSRQPARERRFKDCVWPRRLYTHTHERGASNNRAHVLYANLSRAWLQVSQYTDARECDRSGIRASNTHVNPSSACLLQWTIRSPRAVLALWLTARDKRRWEARSGVSATCGALTYNFECAHQKRR